MHLIDLVEEGVDAALTLLAVEASWPIGLLSIPLMSERKNFRGVTLCFWCFWVRQIGQIRPVSLHWGSRQTRLSCSPSWRSPRGQEWYCRTRSFISSLFIDLLTLSFNIS